VYNFFPFNLSFEGFEFKGYRRPADYEIQFAANDVDTSYADPFLYPFEHPVNFRIYNATDSVFVKFIYVDNDGNGKLSPLDEIVLIERNPRNEWAYTWDIFFINKQGDKPDTVYNLTTGDKLVLKTRKSFRAGDVLEFSTETPQVNLRVASEFLSRVRVVPNPYVTASPHEPPLPPGITSGRGQRKIDFIHLPPDSRVQIFTSRGDHVVTLDNYSKSIEDGTISWNLKTKENLDVAYGVYFYVVESPAGQKTGKLAIIK
jgi:hypothetical protein